MQVKDISIKISKYELRHTPSDTEEIINLFSEIAGVVMPPIFTATEYEISDLLLDDGISDIEFNFDSVSKDVTGGYNLYFDSGNVFLKFDNITKLQFGDNTQTLSEFISIYGDNTYNRYVIKITNNLTGEVLFRGMVSPLAMKLNYAPASPENKVLSLLVVDFLKEIKEYYQNKPLPELNWNQYPDPITYFSYMDLSRAIYTVFSHTNNALNVVVDSTIPNWYIALRPYFYKSDGVVSGFSGFWFIKAGYESFGRAGVSRWDWLKGICAAMGWVIYAKDTTIYLKQRASFNFPTVTIDYSEFKNHEVTQSRAYHFRQIVIPDGVLEGDFPIDRHRGLRVAVLSNTIRDDNQNYKDNLNNQFFWETFSYSTNGTYTAFKMSKDYRFRKRETNVPGWRRAIEVDKYAPDDRVNGGATASSITQTFFPNDETLVIDAIVNDDYPAGIHPQIARQSAPGVVWNGNSYINGAQPGGSIGNQMIYTGNSGNQLFKIVDGSGGQKLFFGYNDYIKSGSFRANFSKFLHCSPALTINATVHKLLTNPLVTIKITNYPHNGTIADKEFAITSHSYDLLNETTRLTLQEKVDE